MSDRPSHTDINQHGFVVFHDGLQWCVTLAAWVDTSGKGEVIAFGSTMVSAMIAAEIKVRQKSPRGAR